MSVQLLCYPARPARYSALSRSFNWYQQNSSDREMHFLILMNYWIRRAGLSYLERWTSELSPYMYDYFGSLLLLCYFRQSVMYRGEVVRRRVPAPGSADPISQSDKLKLYIVIIMILCVIISRCYSLLRDFPDQVNLSPSALEACWQDSQPDLHTDHTRRRNQQDLLPAGPSSWSQSALQTA